MEIIAKCLTHRRRQPSVMPSKHPSVKPSKVLLRGLLDTRCCVPPLASPVNIVTLPRKDWPGLANRLSQVCLMCEGSCVAQREPAPGDI
mmetsp:Transcript_45114/g.81446  ORF Transcript_45114/g.81446 Transcript_45114/m.81446 type:complete len:89 (-) Transcript_45114:2778-3044(-)